MGNQPELRPHPLPVSHSIQKMHSIYYANARPPHWVSLNRESRTTNQVIFYNLATARFFNFWLKKYVMITTEKGRKNNYEYELPAITEINTTCHDDFVSMSHNNYFAYGNLGPGKLWYTTFICTFRLSTEVGQAHVLTCACPISVRRPNSANKYCNASVFCLHSVK